MEGDDEVLTERHLQSNLRVAKMVPGMVPRMVPGTNLHCKALKSG
jgi:hypothetical protein